MEENRLTPEELDMISKDHRMVHLLDSERVVKTILSNSIEQAKIILLSHFTICELVTELETAGAANAEHLKLRNKLQSLQEQLIKPS
jgi:hypothetical protein